MYSQNMTQEEKINYYSFLKIASHSHFGVCADF